MPGGPDLRNALKLAAYSKMKPAQRGKALRDLVVSARQPANGGILQLQAEINEYEARYEMSSAELLQRLKSGEQSETGEIASWLIRLSLLRRIREREARPK